MNKSERYTIICLNPSFPVEFGLYDIKLDKFLLIEKLKYPINDMKEKLTEELYRIVKLFKNKIKRLE